MRGGVLPKVRAKRSANERQATGSGLGYQPPIERRLAADGGEVPGAGAEQLHFRRVEARIGDDRTDLRQRFLAAGEEQRIDRRLRVLGALDRLDDALGRGQHAVGAQRIPLDDGDRAAAALYGAAESGFDDGAVGVVRDQRGVAALTLRGGVRHDALGFLLGEEADEVDALPGDLRVVGEGEHGHVGLARDGRDARDRLRQQRADDDLGAFLDGGIGGRAGARGRCRRRPW